MPYPAESDADADAELTQTLQTATGHHVAGLLDQAETGYLRALALCPDVRHPSHGVVLHRLGLLALQRGRYPSALDLLGRATALDPAAWRSHCGLGQVLAAMERFPEALASFLRASTLNPACAEALLGSGAALLALGRSSEAIEPFRLAADLCPGRADILNNLGIALQGAGQVPEAIAAFRRALAEQDDFPIAHNNLGNALQTVRQVDRALEVLRRTVARWPEFADAWYNLGNAAFAAGLFQEAAEAYGQALTLVPGHVAAANNLGNVLQAMGRNEEALATYLEVLKRNPEFVDAYNNASAAARALGRMDQAAGLLREAIELRPDFHITHCNLGNVLKDIGLMEQAVLSFRRALELDPTDAVTHSNLAYAVCFLPGFGPGAILRENLLWDRAHGQPAPGGRAYPNDPDPDRRLRIGYVSPDFREHCQSLFTLPLLSHHDHSRFEIFGYARTTKPDAVTDRIAGLMDGWCDTSSLDDDQVADRVRSDRIDILVDLTQHMSNGRPRMFARKPAPVQVAWLAYPGTTGLAAMDYRLTDPYLDPPGEHDDWYSETSLRLPDTFWCYDPLTAGPLPGPLPALANGYVTFGCLNNFCKVNPAVLHLWARVISAVPGSRLLLLCPPGSQRQRVLDTLAQGGVGAERIEFAAFRPRPDYLGLHQRVDLGLDTFPYNGHTTSLDAFWMGVPVVTRTGGTVVGRAGWSQLCNLGLGELAATSDEKFVDIAVGLAQDLPRLARLRAGLRSRMEDSPLMDGQRFARNVEAAFRRIWQHWCLHPVT